MERVNNLTDKLHRESENYHERIKSFNKRISELEAEVKYKQNIIEKSNA